MSRRKQAVKRAILPDPLFKQDLVAKFINTIMYDGKKSLAARILYNALSIALKKIHPSKTETQNHHSVRANCDSATLHSAFQILEQAIARVKPIVEVRSRRIGGATYQVPVDLAEERRLTLGMRWLKSYARKRNDGRGMCEKLALEIIDAYHGRGGAVSKKNEVHKAADANRVNV